MGRGAGGPSLGPACLMVLTVVSLAAQALAVSAGEARVAGVSVASPQATQGLGHLGVGVPEPAIAIRSTEVDFMELPPSTTGSASHGWSIPAHVLPPGVVDRSSPMIHSDLSPVMFDGGSRSVARDSTGSFIESPVGAVQGFEAISDTSWLPPDTNGAVGPFHVMTALNGGVRVQTRAGVQVGSQVTLSDWWGLPVTEYAFDPVTLFDALHNRWINVAVSNPDSASSAVLMSVSTGPNPAESWHRWEFDADVSDEMWADRPMVGFSDRWIVVTVNLFDRTGGFPNPTRSQVWAFDIAATFLGSPDGWYWDTLPAGFGFGLAPAVTYDPGVTAVYLLNNFYGDFGGQGWLRMWTITGPTSSPVLSDGQWITVSNPWNDLCGGIGSQLGSVGVEHIDLGDSRMQHVLLQHGRLWAVHTACFPSSGAPTTAGVQWWQLETDGSVVEWGRILDTGGSVLRGYPSIAVNANDDIVVGYARFSASEYAHAAFAFSPSGGEWQEQVFRAGLGSYERLDDDSPPRNRWGDYTATWLDTDGLSVWTIGEYAATPANTWSTWWARIPIADVTAVIAPGSTVGLVDSSQGRWYLRNAAGEVISFFFGVPGDYPFMGDWDCDGVDTPGLYRQSDGFVYLRNSNTTGPGTISFFLGNPGDIPIAGDFDGDGCDTLSVYRPSQGRVFITDTLGENGGIFVAERDYYFGNPGDKPFVGDFDGDGFETIGLHRESTGFVYFRNTHTQGVADNSFFFGNPGDRLVAGDWGIVDGVDTPAVFRPAGTIFYFRHTNTQGNADSQFAWGSSGWLPVAGNFGL